MQVGGGELAIRSFLIATGHGAGLMALPFTLPSSPAHGVHVHHAGASAASTGAALDATAVMATVIHSAGYLLVMGLFAVLVYERLGLRLLRRGWINVDRLWAVALVVTAVVVLS